MSTVTQSNPFAPFSAKDLQEFEIWMNQDKGRSRFTEEKRAEYCDWVRNPHVKPAPGAEQKRLWNHKYDALSHYRVDGDGKLYRTSTAERDRGRSDRRVICESEIFGTIRDVHVELEHAGVNKVAAAIADRYHGIRKIEVEWLLKRCSTCPAERQNRSRAPLEPVMAAKSPPAERVQIERIIASRPLERVQIDLVDLRHEPDGYYHWILHITDHFSKFTSLFPLMTNISEEVARCMAQWIVLEKRCGKRRIGFEEVGFGFTTYCVGDEL
ncbi:hypothetical protein BZA05DRAFT_434069 [Tricharina praecox]|uniref:uncharacterized protein n=1 Tax=Tricharina praecox TaxID=43433 RepID=UPI0022206EC7|nr:uncharacterized protein BZA05DRAFT_434069 [Tricharina praecox]KAI5856515.1 hypothetical protein BZA05DRAFT_434069 [Tricharina praecox]